MPLVEGYALSGKIPSHTDITAKIQQYGDFAEVTDLVEATVESPILNEWSRLMAEQAADTLDELIRDSAGAGTNVFYGGDVGAVANLDGVDNKIDGPVLDRITRDIDNAFASKFTTMISAGLGIDLPDSPRLHRHRSPRRAVHAPGTFGLDFGGGIRIRRLGHGGGSRLLQKHPLSLHDGLAVLLIFVSGGWFGEGKCPRCH